MSEAGPGLPDATRERRQLAILALGFAAIALALAFGLGARRLPWLLGALAVLAGLGGLAHRWIGRGVYLLFFALSRGIGRVVSTLVLGVVYVAGIALFGSFLRIGGLNRLDRDFRSCRKRETMFKQAPPTDAASFGRQS